MHLDQVSLECRHISLSYGNNEVLKDVNLKIEPGEFFALLGPSGCERMVGAWHERAGSAGEPKRRV